MLILLPPSETKRDGPAGGAPLNLAALSFPSLIRERRTALAALRLLSRNRANAATGLRIGPSLAFEIERNRAVTRAPTMPAMDCYTGVLYDGLDAATLSDSARLFVTEQVAIGSALFGLVGAGDPIPAYRLSHDSRLPGVGLRKLWRDATTAVIREHPGLILDLRSEAYVALGPAPAGRSFFLRVVADGPDGTRALNHFNKKGKGQLVRALAEFGERHESVDSLLEWAAQRGIRLSHHTAGELSLVV